MTLTKLLARKRLIVLGLNTGTSADGLDLAAVRILRTDNRITCQFLGGRHKRFDADLRERILMMADSEEVSLDDIVIFDNLLGQFFGKVAATYISKLRREGLKVNVVASHGQTIRHLPQHRSIGRHRIRGTIQLGSLDRVATHTGCVVVGDFRQADIAVGNEGAPITVGAMNRLFQSKTSRLIVNIGGMSNYFYLHPASSGRTPIGRDCGPGNSLCDLLAQRLFNKSFDKNGRLAQQGTVSQRLLSLLLAEPFFIGGQASTGREQFGLSMVNSMIDFGQKFQLTDHDLMATAAELTTTSIATGVWPHVKKDHSLDKLYLTGGGRYNMFFCKRLSYHFPNLEVRRIDDLGIDGDLIEAASFAVLGEAALRSETIPAATRGRGRAHPVLGHIVQPPTEGVG